MDKATSDTALRILDAAEKVFVEKGYDGSRVDEIATRAKINKSQLYYYFGSKENILKELMKRHIKEAGEIVQNTFDVTTISSQASFEEFVDSLLEFFKQKENIIRIIMIEMFKYGSNDFSIFEILDPLYRKVASQVKNMGIEKDDDASPISYFFLDIMPLLFFITFSDKFSAYYNIPSEELEMKFSSLYKKTQTKYFEKLYTKKTSQK